MREAHPREIGYPSIKQPRNFEERVENARRLVREKSMKVTVAIDSMDDQAMKEFGNLPNMVYLFDKEGKIVFKSAWTRAPRIAEVLEELTSDEEKASVRKDQAAAQAATA